MSIISKLTGSFENELSNSTIFKNNRPRNLFLMLGFLISLSGLNVSAQKTDEWPSFHGSDRTNKSVGTGLIKEWPKDGPKLNWTASGLGEGYSSVSIGGGLLYTAGTNSNQTFVFCFDLEGKLVWEKPNGKTWTTTMSHAVSYTGSRSTPTYDNGVIYHLGEEGRLTAFEAKTGRVIWSREFVQDFGLEAPEYGYSESVLIDGDHLFVRPYGKKVFQVCLNKRNGEMIWAIPEIPGTPANNSLVIDEFGGYRQLIGSNSNCFFSLDSKTGRILWKVDVVNQRELNNTDVIVFGEYVFISSGYGKGSMLIRLNTSGKEIVPETVWQSPLMDNHHGGVILHDGYLYGAGSNTKGWFCLDFLTGKEMWKTSGKGSITFADGMLYLLDERGSMKLIRATPDKFESTGEFIVPRGGEGMYWAHPVVCGGTLYIRHADKLYAYDISSK